MGEGKDSIWILGLLKRYKDKVFLCKCIPLEARMNCSTAISFFLSLSLSLSLSQTERLTDRQTEGLTDRQTDRLTDRQTDWLIKEYGQRVYFVQIQLYFIYKPFSIFWNPSSVSSSQVINCEDFPWFIIQCVGVGKSVWWKDKNIR